MKMNRVSLSGTGLCVAFQLRKASRAVTQLYDAALQPAGIRSTQFSLLVAIAKKEPITFSALGEVLVIDTTTLSRTLRTLEQMGNIKIVSGIDRRERLVRLTSKGRDVLEESLPYWRKVQEEVVSELIQPGWRDIQLQLEKITNVSQQVASPDREHGQDTQDLHEQRN
jgi:DNA-binding MarR family transcriptional regulator